MKFLSSDGLKVVLTKIKEMFYTKTEVDEKLKSVSGGGQVYILKDISRQTSIKVCIARLLKPPISMRFGAI